MIFQRCRGADKKSKAGFAGALKQKGGTLKQQFETNFKQWVLRTTKCSCDKTNKSCDKCSDIEALWNHKRYTLPRAHSFEDDDLALCIELCSRCLTTLDDAIDKYEELKLTTHDNYATCFAMKGTIYGRFKMFSEQLNCLKKCEQLRLQIVDASHSLVQRCRNDIENMRMTQGRTTPDESAAANAIKKEIQKIQNRTISNSDSTGDQN